jgi:hypothetical protein
MKSYLFCIRYAGKYYEKVVQAENDEDANKRLLEAVDRGDPFDKVEDEPLYRPDYCFVTFEEVKDVTKVNIGETSVGISMGQQSVSTG